MKGRINRKIIISLSVIFFCLYPSIVLTQNPVDHHGTGESSAIFIYREDGFVPRIAENGYTPDSSVSISSNDGFAVAGFNGTGTLNDPYSFEDISISAGADTVAIIITNTDAYFNINHCFLSGKHGIQLTNVSNGVMSNIICSDSVRHGVRFTNCSYNSLVNITCSGLEQGMYIIDSHFNTFTGNAASSNVNGGITVIGSNNVFTGNTCYDNEHPGIRISAGNNNRLINNSCSSDQSPSIWITDCDNTTLINNSCISNGIYLDSGSDSSILINNSCYSGYTGVRITGNNHTLINNRFWNNSSGIIALESLHLELVNNTSYDNNIGMQINDCPFTLLSNNELENNDECGILLEESPNSVLDNNSCHGSNDGLMIVSSPFTEITGNSCWNNTGNNRGRGIFLDNSSSSMLVNNTCRDNYRGIVIYSSVNTLVKGNNLTGNTISGIFLHGSTSDSLLYGNYFYNNSVQAVDDGHGNKWYYDSNEIGNNWSDYNSTGGYRIEGTAGSVDIFPFVDVDLDGMLDPWEDLMGLNRTVNDAGGDMDQDGLTNLEEYLLDLDASNPDTDGDGMRDGWEVAAGLDAKVDDTDGDSDGDGMTNLYEFQCDLDPISDDSALDRDGDGMPNLWEFRNGFNASDPADAAADTDGDWVSNIDEYSGGSDPRDAASVPLLSFSTSHAAISVLILIVGLVVVTAVIVRKKLRQSLVTKMQAPDYANALKVRAAGFSDYPIFAKMENDALDHLKEGYEALSSNDRDSTIQHYGISLSLYERTKNLPMVAEMVFAIASVLKEKDKLDPENPVLDRFPSSSDNDPVIVTFHCMLEQLLSRKIATDESN